MQTSNILYGSVVSPYVRKVLIALNMKNVSYKLETIIPFIDEHKKRLLQINPLGKTPAYQEDDFIISDSSVICAYLDKKYPAPSVYPVDAKSYAKCLWYEEYANNALTPAIATIFFNTLLAPRFNREPDINAVKIALEIKLPEIFDYLDHEIGNKNYFVDDVFSMADISISAPFINFEFSGYKIDAKRWESLFRYIENISKEKYIADTFQQAKERLENKPSTHLSEVSS